MTKKRKPAAGFRTSPPPCSPFRYLIFLYVAEDGPYTSAPFYADTPVAVGHEIDWAWNPKNPKEEMHLEVTGICHREGKTILYCEYDDIYEDSYLVGTCVKLGMRKDWAKEKPQAVREMRDERYRANNMLTVSGGPGEDHDK